MAFQAQPACKPIPELASSLPPSSSHPPASWGLPGQPKSKKAHPVTTQQDRPASARVTVTQAQAADTLKVTFYLLVYTE